MYVHYGFVERSVASFLFDSFYSIIIFSIIAFCDIHKFLFIIAYLGISFFQIIAMKLSQLDAYVQFTYGTWQTKLNIRKRIVNPELIARNCN